MGAKGFMFFSASMDLTEEGMGKFLPLIKHLICTYTLYSLFLIKFNYLELVEEVVTATFQYLSMLRNMEPQKWVHEECAVSQSQDYKISP